ncbi:MAG TPA: hypothetical protein PK629_09630 [Oscillospiraceae bacterium]|nr:hypothetical protein [Oscillospiraceae bacterium]HPF56215.1 hypothetical protein [Clostridiales bacterium]HPK34935.1 hypothetical protein [Oscillospiraceae bacterium]HPR75356.1 hypothetical protein [Oscillospiraceae bacterium]
MKKVFAVILVFLMCGCAPVMSHPVESETVSYIKSEATDSIQSAVSAIESKATESETVAGEEDNPSESVFAELPMVTAEVDAVWLAASEFAAEGIKPDTDVESMKAVFGVPAAEIPEYGTQIDSVFYQYDGVQFEFFVRVWDDSTEDNTCRAYKAVFTENLVEFPRGIRIGDKFEDVLKKFPQEIDYKESGNGGRFYGDCWSKRKLGWGSVSIRNGDPAFDDGVWIFVASDEYWPMLQVHFTDALIADKIVVQFSAYPFG